MKQPIFQIMINPIDKQVNFIYNFVKDSINDDIDWYLKDFNLDKSELIALSNEELKEKINQSVSEIYLQRADDFMQMLDELCKKVDENYQFVLDEFSRIFGVGYKDEQEYKVCIGVSQICPRYLSDYSFDVCLNHSIDDNFETILHELTHFYWFDKITKLYPNIKKSEFEQPHLTWLLSEIVVDAILKNSNFNKFLVYKPAYNYFYEVDFNGKNMMDLFSDMYKKSKDMEEFIVASTEFVNGNKDFFKKLID
ncbi:MAG: hypothetical protein ACI4TX_00695 [Christensenellales bacterium]